MMFWSVHDMSGWGYAGMAVGMVLFWILVIVGIVALVRFSTGSAQAYQAPRYPAYPESPEQLLAARFARGEIDDAEYQQRLATLRGTMSG
ncbi:putative membrane protein [Mycolicibacterium sp. BK556]|uniref:SHOCT domain-containing protein n=1 Tax=Mycobacteriaceae TaxID=1762 RepID=UPI00105B91F6|nr:MULTISPECIES: SHOCT domain-containing protein [Mycobacteriaceae]MBB3604477.1 putative membrane protein [Mycolicibacterium sp. BK556]MBB3634810.1 putative membrane protein [Mycolicibacterium sp. BK607]MBB3752381.1 putative membrane protein [Mycolicibacterium sp. BK634]TDO17376.1 putative membrane protein [Mycobacterium sp. BK086]